MTSAARAETTLNLDEQLDLFLEWFPGEYDNNEQVWQQMQDGLEGDALATALRTAKREEVEAKRTELAGDAPSLRKGWPTEAARL